MSAKTAARDNAQDRPRKLEVVQIRICAPRDLSITSFADWRKDDPLTLHRDLGQWVSPRDLAQLFVKSVEAPNIEDEYGIPFQVFYGVSANTRSAWSIANARRIIGYERFPIRRIPLQILDRRLDRQCRAFGKRLKKLLLLLL